MGIANPEVALEKLREFRVLVAADLRDQKGGSHRSSLERLIEMQPLIEAIARKIDPDNAALLRKKSAGFCEWPIWDTDEEALRLVGILEERENYRLIFGPVGPTLAASRLHPWVWHAAGSLWDGGHYDSAVHAATKAVERHTQLSVGRLDLDGKALYGHAFSIKDPRPGERRLRFPDINRTVEPKRWTSAHEGAMSFGQGCAQGIRNPQAHPSPDLTEQEALEQLAALSVLARWVDECDVVGVADGATGE